MINQKEIEHIAALAHLKFNDDELNKFSSQFSKIVDYVSSIENLNLDDVEPMTRPTDAKNVFREDIPQNSISKEDALKNAPKHNEMFFKVPKVIE
jgi:aspartyl-tRNA(Asn)/glutamyl-tRNA(Gln) amidotransferase subunit C